MGVLKYNSSCAGTRKRCEPSSPCYVGTLLPPVKRPVGTLLMRSTMRTRGFPPPKLNLPHARMGHTHLQVLPLQSYPCCGANQTNCNGVLQRKDSVLPLLGRQPDKLQRRTSAERCPAGYFPWHFNRYAKGPAWAFPSGIIR